MIPKTSVNAAHWAASAHLTVNEITRIADELQIQFRVTARSG